MTNNVPLILGVIGFFALANTVYLLNKNPALFDMTYRERVWLSTALGVVFASVMLLLTLAIFWFFGNAYYGSLLLIGLAFMEPHLRFLQPMEVFSIPLGGFIVIVFGMFWVQLKFAERAGIDAAEVSEYGDVAAILAFMILVVALLAFDRFLDKRYPKGAL